MRSIWKREGWTGFYRGLGPSIIGISHVAVQFPLYERLKRLDFMYTTPSLSSPSSSSPTPGLFPLSLSHFMWLTFFIVTVDMVDPPMPSTWRLILASTLSKLVASTATYPHEVIRTRLQNETNPPIKYSSFSQTVRLMWREEGWRGFYRGLKANLVRTVPASAVTLLSYETLSWLLRSYFPPVSE